MAKNTDLSSLIQDEFIKAMSSFIKSNLPSTGEVIQGVITQINGMEATVALEGSTVTTIADLQTESQVNDTVMVEIKDHKAVVVRNLTYAGGGHDLPNGDYMGYGTTT